MIWSVGDGNSIDFWRDAWIPWLPRHKPLNRNVDENLKDIKVADVLYEQGLCWNLNCGEHLSSSEEIRTILLILIPRSTEEDSLVWAETKDGCYTVKSSYHSMFKATYYIDLSAASHSYVVDKRARKMI